MFITKISVIVILLLPSLCFSFDWQRCKELLPESSIGLAPIFFTMTSSGQWSTSTGDCSMTSEVGIEKKLFMVQNQDRLIIDSAKGEGEYLNAYLSLSNCNSNKISKAQDVIRSNFINIYGADLNNTPEESYNSLETLINNDPILNFFCFASSS